MASEPDVPADSAETVPIRTDPPTRSRARARPPAAAPQSPAEASPVLPLQATPVRESRTGSRAGTVGVALVLATAGLLFTTSAATSRGTQLRSERADLADLIAAEDRRVATQAQQVGRLHETVDRDARATSVNDRVVRELEEKSSAVVAAAGLTAVSGPGLTVTLNDAPRDGRVPPGVGPDELVVHQQDVQAVVNALWAGGAEAMTLMDQRVIATSAVRCVGNTLILQGRVYSPPYRITAIGDVNRLQDALRASPYIAYYQEYVERLGLGWSVEPRKQVRMPAYAGSLTLSHARVAGRPATPNASTTDPTGSAPTTTPDQEETP